MSWRNLGRDLVGEPNTLSQWSAALRTHFARGLGVDTTDVNVRAVNSTIHLGLCSRLLSPWIALAAMGQPTPAPSLDRLRWQPDSTTRFPLAVDEQDLTDASLDEVIRSLRGLADAVNVLGLIESDKIMWGNIASAVNGAVVALAAAQPTVAQSARQVGAALLMALPPDLHRGQLAHTSFQRQSCCLINTLTSATRDAICGDCIHQVL